MNQSIFEKWGFIFAIALFFFSLFFVYYYSTEFLGSLLAAVLTSALGWISFVLVRLTILALRK